VPRKTVTVTLPPNVSRLLGPLVRRMQKTHDEPITEASYIADCVRRCMRLDGRVFGLLNDETEREL